MAIVTAQDENDTSYFLEAKRQWVNSLLIAELWVVPAIIGCYLIYIMFGNLLMKNRRPLKIRSIMLGFNIFQIFYNLHLFCQCARSHVMVYYINDMCNSMDPSKKEIWTEIYRIAYWFFVSKLVDLIDTVFLVLLKKVDQISFLHLYHHVGMAAYSWIVLRYYSSTIEHTLIVFFLNSFVHVVMYTYYFLSLLGPNIQKYLWWKRYVTLLQLAQFIIFIGYMAALLVYGCAKPKDLSVFMLVQAIIFFALFENFYNNHYRQPCKSISTDKVKGC